MSQRPSILGAAVMYFPFASTPAIRAAAILGVCQEVLLPPRPVRVFLQVTDCAPLVWQQKTWRVNGGGAGVRGLEGGSCKCKLAMLEHITVYYVRL